MIAMIRPKSMTPKEYLALAVVGYLLFLGLYAASPRRLLNFGLSESPAAEYGTGATASMVSSNSGGQRPAQPEDDQPVPSFDDPSEIHEKYVIYEDKCRIRNHSHNEPEILREFFAEEPVGCPKNATPFVFYPEIDAGVGQSCVGLDHAVVKASYGGCVDLWNCTFRETRRSMDEKVVDLYFHFGDEKVLRAGDCPTEEFVWIECRRPGILEPYSQPLMLPRVKPVRAPIRPNNFGEKPFHVLVLGLDAISRLNAYRQLPKTLEFLRTKTNAVELFGYNKIEDNSMPNQIPLLTGIPFAKEGMHSRLHGQYFDNLTRYIWEHYEERGYRTMFYEEQWQWGLFVYGATRGFKKVPTTYWPRPLMQAIDNSSLKERGNKLCIGPDLAAKHYLDYTYNTMRVLGDKRPLFSYSWLSEAGHDNANGGHRDDRHFLEFFTKMDKSGLLNKTAVIFISDHGSRIGEFRNTPLGRHEDMLPFGFISMPDLWYKYNPMALENLRVNSKRLVTVYDLHATLLELADQWSEARAVRTAKGYSLFSNTIPSGRTCRNAGVNFQYCSCFESQPYDTGSTLSKSLAQAVIFALNDVIKSNVAVIHCRKWSLGSVDNFVRLSEGNKWTDYFKITIETEPTAQFEAAAELQKSDQKWTLLSDIDRIDWFRDTSECVKGTSYEKYCYCR